MSIDNPTLTQQEFHRRRSDSEMEKALAARKMSVALIHLELAKIHRQQREQLIGADRVRSMHAQPRRISRTDKEG